MSHHEACLGVARRPNLKRGETLRDGKYLRNVDEVQLRYAKDCSQQPVYGYKVKPNKLRWGEADGEGLSVNCVQCAQCPDCSACASCSIYLTKSSERHQHVVQIDLQLLAETLGVELVAEFDPDPEDHDNPCHFNIVATEARLDEVELKLKKLMVDDFPAVKIPGNSSDKQQAQAAKERYDRVFVLHKDVRKVGHPLDGQALAATAALHDATPTKTERPNLLSERSG